LQGKPSKQTITSNVTEHWWCDALHRATYRTRNKPCAVALQTRTSNKDECHDSVTTRTSRS